MAADPEQAAADALAMARIHAAEQAALAAEEARRQCEAREQQSSQSRPQD
jgi:hypothetical protein